MTVVPEAKDKTPITVNVPVTKKENGAVEPPDAVKTLAAQLRVGDELQLTYVKSGTMLKYGAATAKAAADPTSDEATVFTFVGRRTVPLRGKETEALFVSRAGVNWTFLLPDADTKTDGYQPDAELLKKVKECRRGNTVRLTYDPAEYMFWLRGVEIVKPAADEKKGTASGSPKTQDSAAGAGSKAQESGAEKPAKDSAPAAPAAKS